MTPVPCRDHGMALTRSWLGKTVVQGWWGVISFFVSWFVVASDIAALVKASRDEPKPAAAA